MVSDKYYGRRDIAILCERTLNHHFQKSKATPCPQQIFHVASTSSCKVTTTTTTMTGTTNPNSPNVPQLREWIAYILYRTALPNYTVFHALHLLRRLSVHFACDPSIPSPPLFHHRLIVACLVLATDWSMDDAYSKKSWSIACRNVFSLEEINEMEISLLRSLDWQLRLDGEDLEAVVKGMEAEWNEEVRWQEEERRRWKEVQRRQKEADVQASLKVLMDSQPQLQQQQQQLQFQPQPQQRLNVVDINGRVGSMGLKEMRRQSTDSARTIRPSIMTLNGGWGSSMI